MQFDRSILISTFTVILNSTAHRSGKRRTKSYVSCSVLVRQPAATAERDESGHTPAVTGDWSWKGVTLPAGTELRMTLQWTDAHGLFQAVPGKLAAPLIAVPRVLLMLSHGRGTASAFRSTAGFLWEVLKPESRGWVLLDKLRPANGRAQRGNSRPSGLRSSMPKHLAE